MNLADIELRVPRALVLQIQIAALREALHCVTDPCAPAVIYGRIDGLINDRQQALESIYVEKRHAAEMAHG